MTAPLTLTVAVLTTLAVALVLAPAPGHALPRRPARPPAGDASAGPVPGRAVAGSRDAGERGAERGRPGARGTGLAAAAAGLTVALLIGSALGIALGAVAAPLAWRWLTGLEPAAARRRREQLERELPLLVDLVAACLRAGQAPGPALAAVSASLEPGPLREETQRFLARLGLGGDPVATWRALGAHPQLGPLGRTLTRALESGASVADAVGDLAQELRRTRRGDVHARARTVGTRAAAPLGLCLLPAFVLVGVVPVVAGSLGALLTP